MGRGADAVLVVTPYYNKPNHAGLRAHFEAVADAAGDVPVVLYNIPSRCVINLPPDLLAELARIDNVVAVKQANNDELQPIDGLDVLAGNDEIFLRTLELGGPAGSSCPRTSSVGRCATSTTPRRAATSSGPRDRRVAAAASTTR